MVFEPEALGIKQGFGVQLAGIKSDREPLHQVSGVGRMLERRRRVQLVRLRLDHAVLARTDQESAQIQGHTQVAARYIDVSHQHVEEFVGEVVKKAVGM